MYNTDHIRVKLKNLQIYHYYYLPCEENLLVKVFGRGGALSQIIWFLLMVFLNSKYTNRVTVH